MPTRSLIEQIIYKYFRINTSPKKAREQTDEVMAMFDKEFVSKAELKDRIDKEIDKWNNYDEYYDNVSKALTDIKNLDILK